jgi:hypothetical protein
VPTCPLAGIQRKPRNRKRFQGESVWQSDREWKMILRMARPSIALAGLLSLAAVLLANAPAKAETVYIKNDTEATIVINVSTIVGGKVVREKPIVVGPGKTGVIMVPGNKVVQISDAKTARTYFDGTLPASRTDQSYVLEMDGTKMKLEMK